jgi:hypothetical protein
MANRQRTIHKQFRLTEKEAAAFERKVARSGLTQAEYLRQLISGLEPSDTPPPDYYAMMAALRRLRQVIERYSELANEFCFIPIGANDYLCEQVREVTVAITKAVVEPSKVSR